jgi:uncharacterized protein YdeI (YjbR/CyaY-like superfamily)
MAIEITETISPTSAADWRTWLEKHHSSKKEIWLVFYKKHTGKQAVSYKEVLDEALCFGWIDGIEKGIDNERFALRFTPRRDKSLWSEINVARYKDLKKQGRMTRAGTLAFEKKFHVYGSMSNKKEARDWHLTHPMPKNPSLTQRIKWHKEHQKYCTCRPIPENLKKYLH